MIRLINKIVIHCADTYDYMDIGADWIRDLHTRSKANGGNEWKDIGYHYVIRRNGAIEQGRLVRKIGAHVKGHNHDSLGICLAGGKGADHKPCDNFTMQQRFTLENLLITLNNVYPDAEILGHRDLDDNKECPCFEVKDFIKHLKLRGV